MPSRSPSPSSRMASRSVGGVVCAFTLALLGAAASPRLSQACMPAPPADHWVRIAEERAVITYDPKTRTEHFIRRASFESDVTDFGFIVPVPSKPTLTEADGAVFDRLEALTRPKIVYTSHLSGIDPTPLVLGMFLLRSASVETAPLSSVHVVDQLTVAGYDAVVLEADSATGLAEWLAKHGYAKGPEVEAWVAPYVAKHWYFAAFRMAPKGAGADTGPEKRIGSGTVDLAFSTDRPLYPYREPESMRAPGARATRSLAVFFVGPERVGGTLGEKATWAGVPNFAKKLDDDVPGVPGGTRGLFLSQFVDRSSPRPGTDEVYFQRLDVQAELIPEPIEIAMAKKVPVPIDAVLVVGAGLFFAGRAIRKRRERDK